MQQAPEVQKNYLYIKDILEILQASRIKVNPLWVQNVVHELRAAKGDASILLERCKTVRAFTSGTGGTLFDDAPDKWDWEPLESTILIPSAPLMAVHRVVDKDGEKEITHLVIGLLWDHGTSYLIFVDAEGYEGFDVLLKGMRYGKDLNLGIVEGSMATRTLVKWLASDSPAMAVQKVMSTPAQRHAARKIRVHPIPYYVVHPVKEHPLNRRAPTEGTPRAPFSFRFERRSHLRLFVERSAEPLKAREGWQLIGPKDEAGPKLQQHLVARGHDKKQLGEWMLVRIATVSAHVVGPEDKPFVPSTKVKVI